MINFSKNNPKCQFFPPLYGGKNFVKKYNLIDFEMSFLFKFFGTEAPI